MLRVRDIMTPEVVVVGAGETLDSAAQLLTDERIGGAPVIENGRIVGVISKTDLVDPDHKKKGKNRVEEVMTKVIYGVRPRDPVMSAVRLMALENVHRAVVIDGDGRLAGMVTPMDVIRALARGDRVQEGDAAVESQREWHAEPEGGVGFIDLRSIEIRTRV